MANVNITTKSGFKCNVNKDVLKDWRVIKALASCESDNTEKVIKGLVEVIPMILGKDEEKLIDHCTKKGICDIQTVIEEFKEILSLMRATEKK